ncbi:hypothetical protein C8J57DRAFT_1720357 [Mycena rebaudengoi]|nr:hypothetical protein C8J57DRAFT_1720357 [Mycena rebaudengoi]
MDLGSHFAAKLEPFLLMAKSLKGAAAAKLIADATSAPGVFVFSELLELNNIQELSKSETHSKSFALLQLFAYRTYEDYLQNKDAYPPLNAAQTTKLKHLSIVSLAASRRILPYSDLLRALEMPTIRELEDLIIDAIYLDILRGKLDQKQEQLEVEFTMGRDLAPGAIDDVLAALKHWAATTSAVLQTLDSKIALVSSRATDRRAALAQHEQKLQAVLRDAAGDRKGGNGGKGRSGGLGLGLGMGGNNNLSSYGYGDAMDVDEPGGQGQENVKGKGRKPTQESAKPQRKRNRF